MPRTTQHPTEDSFNFRVDRGLKTAFQNAAGAEDRPAAQVLRDLMRAYVDRRRGLNFVAEARRQSRLIARTAADPASDEAEVTRWIESASDVDGWSA